MFKKGEIKANTPRDTKIKFSKPEQFIGLEIHKRNIIALCVSYENYTTKAGKETWLLNWVLTNTETGNNEAYKTSWDLRVGDIPAKLKNVT